MKTTSLTVLTLLLLTTSVIAQVKTETSDPPDVSVLEKSWSKETRHRESDPKKQNPSPRTPNEDLMRQARDGNGKSVIANQNDSPANQTQPIIVHRTTTYVYKIKIKNNGLKTIKTLYWEYQFIDPDTQEAVGTHRMVSSKKLSPSKTGVFKAETVQPPSAFVSENQFDKKFPLKFTEQLVIYRVDYTDGSVWRRP